VKVRYKQTALGVIWVVLQPLLATLIFTVIFGNLARMPSGNLPYAVFAFTALLPWNYFAGAIGRAGISLVGNSNLITKVYFPRLIIPISGVSSGLIDFAVSFAVLLVLMLAFGVVPGWPILTLPLFLAMAMATALGVSLWLAALNVQYRDINHLLPFVVQIWMYASPVVYAVSLIPAQWRTLYGLNPMVGVIAGFRWALTGQEAPTRPMLLVSLAVTAALLASGLLFFRRTERTFADIV
jgi:lipopolysaccharide transport system permease protein